MRRPYCGLLAAVSLKPMAAERGPSAPGANTTETVQRPCGATVAPVQWSVPGAMLKSLLAVPVMNTLLTVSCPGPALPRAIVRAVLVVPSAWLKKLVTSGLTPVFATSPDPLRATVWGLLDEVSVTVNVPVTTPDEVG